MAGFDSALADPRAETTVGNYFVSNYPPYSTWKADAASQLDGVLARPAPDESLSLYVHLPFCRRRCNYCYFRVHAGSRRGVVDRYLDSVLEELSLYLRYPAVGGRRLFRSTLAGIAVLSLRGADPAASRRASGPYAVGRRRVHVRVRAGDGIGAKVRRSARASRARCPELTPRVLALSGTGASDSLARSDARRFREINMTSSRPPGETEES